MGGWGQMGGFRVWVDGGGEGSCLLEAALTGSRIDSPLLSTLPFQPAKGTKVQEREDLGRCPR